MTTEKELRGIAKTERIKDMLISCWDLQWLWVWRVFDKSICVDPLMKSCSHFTSYERKFSVWKVFINKGGCEVAMTWFIHLLPPSLLAVQLSQLVVCSPPVKEYPTFSCIWSMQQIYRANIGCNKKLAFVNTLFSFPLFKNVFSGGLLAT